MMTLGSNVIGLLDCPAVYPDVSASLPMRIGSISFLRQRIVENMVQADKTEDAKDAWKFLGHPKETSDRLPREFAEAWYRMEVLPIHRPTWVGILQRVVELRGTNPGAAFTSDTFASIQAPVNLLWGSEDPFGSIEKERAGARHLDEFEFHDVGSGHLPRLDEPEQSGELLREFLDWAIHEHQQVFPRFGHI